MRPRASHTAGDERLDGGAGPPGFVRFPRIVVNAKAYAESSGVRGAQLARSCAAAGARSAEPIALAPPATELAYLSRLRLAGLSLFAQHVDPIPPGVGTGFTTAQQLLDAGAAGAILNHAEHKMPQNGLAIAVAHLHQLGLHSLVCADSLAQARAVARLRPTAIAIEPPELIGGDVSVTNADPEIVSGAVDAVRKIAPDTLTLCGAGVKTGADVRAALELGAHGVLLASGVVKAKDAAAALANLLSGL